VMAPIVESMTWLLGTVMSMVCSMPRRCARALSGDLPGRVTAAHSGDIDLPEDFTGWVVCSPAGRREPPHSL